MDWKTNIQCQLKRIHDESSAFGTVFTNYNHLLETNVVLRSRCSKVESELENLRLAKFGLEQAQKATEDSNNIKNRLEEANEEVLTHLREKGELAHEILRLNRSLNEVQQKLSNEETKSKQLQIENENLLKKCEQLESDNYILISTKEIIYEERQALKEDYEKLRIEYNEMKPAFLQISQKLEEMTRLVEERETELIRCKSAQLDMYNSEVERYNRRLQERKNSETSVISSSSVDVSNQNRGNSLSQTPEKQGGAPGPANFFANLKTLFTPGNQNPNSALKIDVPAPPCFAAVLPKRSIYEWDCTELEVYSMQFHPSGTTLVTGSSDKMLNFWDISSSGRAHRILSFKNNQAAINVIDFDNERSRLLAAAGGSVAYVWVFNESDRPKETFTGHTGVINACKFQTSRYLWTGSVDRTIKKWDLHTRQCVRTLFPPSKCHDLAIIDPLGTVLSAHHDKKIRIWDTLNDQCRDEILCDSSVTSLSFNPDNQLISACLKDDSIQIIDLRQRKVLFSLRDEHFQVGHDTHKAVFSPDGQYICSGSNEGSVLIWNAKNGQIEQVFEKRHKTMVTSVVWHPEGKYVASSEKQRRVILWSD